MGEPEKDPIPDWVETVTRAAGALGFNKVRVRWKLQGWVNRQRAAARREEQSAAHMMYEHRVCRHCRAVNDKHEKVCTRCQQPLGSRAVELLGRFGIHAPRALSVGSLIGVILVATYIRVFAAGGGNGVTLPLDALVAHGASLPADYPHDEPWRAFTSVLLHAGLAHLAFNLFALASIAPVAEDRFGRGLALVIFVVTGILGSLGSTTFGPPAIGVGASGAIMGLVGAVAAAGHRAGTAAGRAQRDDMIKWVLYTFLFGFVVGADHYAHGAGLAAGGVIGGLVPTQVLTKARARPAQIALGAVAVAALVAATVAVMVPLQGTPVWAPPVRDDADDAGTDPIGEWPTDDPGDLDDLGTQLWLCSDRATPEDIATFGKETIAEVCEALDQERALCRTIVAQTSSASTGNGRRRGDHGRTPSLVPAPGANAREKVRPRRAAPDRARRLPRHAQSIQDNVASGSPSASATAACTMRPSKTLTPARRPGSRSTASRQPSPAICST
jgi:membrane associated rhomboid family serine protease